MLKLLISGNFYAPSVHCSYYSVFQSMKCKYLEKSGTTIEEYNVQAESAGSHVSLINSFLPYINDFKSRKSFKRKVVDLKTLRKQSDYDDIEINIDESNNALRKAKELVSIIKAV